MDQKDILSQKLGKQLCEIVPYKACDFRSSYKEFIISSLNECLCNSFGYQMNWVGYITKIINNNASSLSKRNLGEDAIVSITGDLVIDSLSNASFRNSLERAKSDSLLSVQKVVGKATRFRTKDFVKKKSPTVFFNEVSTDGDFDEYGILDACDDSLEVDLFQIQEELQLLASQADWKQDKDKAMKYRRASLILADRIEGMTLDAIMKKHNIKSHSVMFNLLDTIKTVTSKLLEKN